LNFWGLEKLKKIRVKKIFMKRLTILLIPVVVYACSTSQAGDAEDTEVARLSHIEPTTTEVGTVPVLKGAFELELISNGKLEAQRRAVVPFAVQEQIVDVSVQEGQSIAAGQTLGKVEAFTFQNRMSDAPNSLLMIGRCGGNDI
jgi:multidrug efflux pump subunit AcrA (membrane-fusion protein)